MRWIYFFCPCFLALACLVAAILSPNPSIHVATFYTGITVTIATLFPLLVDQQRRIHRLETSLNQPNRAES